MLIANFLVHLKRFAVCLGRIVHTFITSSRVPVKKTTKVSFETVIWYDRVTVCRSYLLKQLLWPIGTLEGNHTWTSVSLPFEFSKLEHKVLWFSGLELNICLQPRKLQYYLHFMVTYIFSGNVCGEQVYFRYPISGEFFSGCICVIGHSGGLLLICWCHPPPSPTTNPFPKITSGSILAIMLQNTSTHIHIHCTMYIYYTIRNIFHNLFSLINSK